MLMERTGQVGCVTTWHNDKDEDNLIYEVVEDADITTHMLTEDAQAEVAAADSAFNLISYKDDYDEGLTLTYLSRPIPQDPAFRSTAEITAAAFHEHIEASKE
jgi:hypothetical protein